MSSILIRYLKNDFAFTLGFLAIIPFLVPIFGVVQENLPRAEQFYVNANQLSAGPVQNATLMNHRNNGEKLERTQPFMFSPIGTVHSPYSPDHRPPRQGRLAPDVAAQIEIYETFEKGLEGIEDFDHIFVLFVFDRSHGWNAHVTPPGAKNSRGVFSTRSPNRPCPIGLTVVQLEKREGNILYVKGIDAFDGTPVLDIKPYVSSIDSFSSNQNESEKKLGLQ